MSIIEVKNLSKTYDYYEKEVGISNSIKNLFDRKKLYKEAVKNISFNVEEGEILGFLGPNGAGKTTTLKALSGILYPTSGEASVNGYIPWKREKKFKMIFSMVMGQKSQLWWDLPASESLYLNKCIYEIEDDVFSKTLNELAEMLDVKNILNVQVRRLSLGERMKMELIASLIHRPKILLLDEPTIGLDIIAQQKIRDFFKDYNKKEKTTILLTSHYMSDIEDLCERCVIINQGQIAYDGHLNQLNSKISSNKYIKLKFSDYIVQKDIEKYGFIKEYDGYNVTIEVDKKDLRHCLQVILGDLPVIDFNIDNIPIEERISMYYEK